MKKLYKYRYLFAALGCYLVACAAASSLDNISFLVLILALLGIYVAALLHGGVLAQEVMEELQPKFAASLVERTLRAFGYALHEEGVSQETLCAALDRLRVKDKA